MKRQLHRVQPVPLRLLALAAQPDLRRAVQVERDIRHQPASGKPCDLLEGWHVQSMPVTLVSQRGVVEAVTQHDLARRQRRANHLPHVLGTRRAKEQGLRFGRHGGVFQAVEQDVADLFRDGCAARLAGRQDRVPRRLEGGQRAVILRGFAGTLRPFKRDKHGSSLSVEANRCPL